MNFSKEVEFIKKRDAIEGNWMQWIAPKYEMRYGAHQSATNTA